MMSVVGVLQDKLSQLKRAPKVYLAYSGGLDSSVLLHLLAEAELSFTAIHINHQLSVNADVWQQHCEQHLLAYKIPLQVYKVHVEKESGGLEEAARRMRYAIFEDLMEKGDVLLTAHHADDQAETLLYRLMRGAGLRGLSSMRSERLLGAGTILRPLLAISREKIKAYAEQNALEWVDDESNKNEQFDRNYLRKQVLPVLQYRWSSAQVKLSKAADLIAKESDLLSEYAAIDMENCQMQEERQGQSLCAQALKGFSDARVCNVLRFWMQKQGYTAASESQMAQVLNLIRAQRDARPEVLSKSWCFRRFGQRIYLLPPPSLAPLQQRDWDAKEPLVLENGASLSLIHGVPEKFSIRFRKGGERCRPVGRRHSQTLKKLLQEYRLEPWWRDGVPLIYSGNELVAVGDLFVCEPKCGYLFRWQLPREKCGSKAR